MTAKSGTVLIKFEFKKNYFSISLPGTSRTIGTNLCSLMKSLHYVTIAYVAMAVVK